MNRREFVASTAGALLAHPRLGSQPSPITARAVVDRIKEKLGVEWRADTVDTFKAGNPDTRVNGIATTVMATMSVLERAAAAGRNFVITHEPTFYGHTDTTTELEADPIYRRKIDLIQRHDLVVWRFHDHWHMRRPEPMTEGLFRELGWDAAPVDNRVRTIPETTLEGAVRHVESRLGVRAIRVIGERATRVSKVVFMPGYGQLPGMMRALADADLVISGEQREWEGLYYAHDLVSSGRPKGVIVLGHAISEEPGMKVCAEWLKTFMTGVPVELIPAGEPFWR